MKKHQTTGIWILVAVLLMVVFASSVIIKDQNTISREITQAELLKKAEAGQLTTAKIQGSELSATDKDGKLYKIYLPNNQFTADRIFQTLEKSQIQVDQLPAQDDGKWLGLLSTLVIPLVILGLVILMIRSAQGGGAQAMSFGKSRAKMMPENKIKITFADVAGVDECKAELEEVVDYLKNPEKYQKLGARIPKGVLLVGSPGTGKTLLAKAVAGEAGVAFFSISGSDFVEMFVGVGASRVRDLFEQAKKHAPCIIFMDEIDAVGRQRGAGMGGGHDEREQTLNQLLVEMDGFESTGGIIVLAATNRPDILDNALLRPGRFDRQVVLDRPDIKGRYEILKVHAKGKPLAKEVNLKRLAKSTPGFTGADLENLINEAALLAARNDAEVINQDNLEEAIDKVYMGPEKKSKIIKEKEKEKIAYHEVGHALVSILCPGGDKFRKVTIIPRGMALGLSWTMPDDDNHLSTKEDLQATIARALAGRVAEELIYGEITTGASNDIEKATDLARRMVTVYGMSEKLGTVKFGNQNEHVFMGRDFGTERNYSDQVAYEIDKEIKEIIDTQYALARRLLSDNRDMLESITKILLEEETLEDKQVYEIMDRALIDRGQEPQYALSRKPEDLQADDDVFGPEKEEPASNSTEASSDANAKGDEVTA